MRIKIGTEHVTPAELVKRIEADDAWIKVLVPGDRAGTAADGTERANWAEEMLGECALPAVPEGGQYEFFPDKDWMAFIGMDGKSQMFFFKDPDLACAFRLARG